MIVEVIDNIRCHNCNQMFAKLIKVKAEGDLPMYLCLKCYRNMASEMLEASQQLDAELKR